MLIIPVFFMFFMGTQYSGARYENNLNPWFEHCFNQKVNEMSLTEFSDALRVLPTDSVIIASTPNHQVSFFKKIVVENVGIIGVHIIASSNEPGIMQCNITSNGGNKIWLICYFRSRTMDLAFGDKYKDPDLFPGTWDDFDLHNILVGYKCMRQKPM